MIFLCALTNSVGGFEKLAPDASINDGKFTVLALRKCSLAEFASVIMAAAKGEHLTSPNVIYRKVEKVVITSNDVVHINLDGEYGGDAPATFENLMRHIELFVPIHEIKETDRV